MTAGIEGTVALVTGAGRGQGRAHAVRLAEEGADVVAVDICAGIPTVAYPLATPEDLAETARLVQATGRRVLARRADVRDRAALDAVVAEAVATLGPIRSVVANAGIAPLMGGGDEGETFADVLAVNLTGAWNTVKAAAPSMIEAGRGGAVVLVSSTQGLKGTGGDGTAGITGYAASKHGLVGLMRSFAHWLAPHSIRVNTVHPTGVPTPMITNEVMQAHLRSAPATADRQGNLLPLPMVDVADVCAAVVYLLGDSGRALTGVTLPVDAGFAAR
ncbi:mycofactocin-coupled SDR family oxidoreductase [Trujillonella endophytica]|uniref:SDR family mycofactocin-dependent oxidoreductase n=1 Tax=Trujillonella endophytica TaxID=673521 RepID=A0A1H8QHM0_9ACTN|nr:mycofactocin-coupled SDR family oxidoreductase [Trujillella endophytica]SEO53702.1 SDR family mycofactocin-dependent oxidoreductase [Trujillella endophytica]